MLLLFSFLGLCLLFGRISFFDFATFLVMSLSLTPLYSLLFHLQPDSLLFLLLVVCLLLKFLHTPKLLSLLIIFNHL